ncbi:MULTISPECIES: purine-cytosine permease family protein [Bacillus]|uniref:purine-cytosine permease family protein n=1 Tax=Bacillus TaxID=1386 RepID=UPI000BB8D254|nr:MULTISPECIES: cytosine permease [Bacillus]
MEQAVKHISSKPSRIERFGLESVPQELRKTRWYEYTIIQIAFSVNAGNFLVPALAVLEGGLSFTEAFLSTIIGATLAFVFVSLLSIPGAKNGIPSQFAIRSMIGVKGARFISSPIRTITSLYWFSVQTVGGALVIQHLLKSVFAISLPFFLVASSLAIIMTVLALIGFEAVKKATKYFMPILLIGQGMMIFLLLRESNLLTGVESTAAASNNISTMLFFASLAFVQYVSGVSSSADMTRYAITPKEGFIGLFSGNVIGFMLTAFFGAYTASLTNEWNPFIVTTNMTDSYIIVFIIIIAAILSMISINLSNAYTGGFSLLNSLPGLGRVKAAILFGLLGITLSLTPTLVNEAKQFISLLGGLVIPLSAVIVVDFIFKKRLTLNADEIIPLYNKQAFYSITLGMPVYFLLPEDYSPGFIAFLITGLIYLMLFIYRRKD